MAQYCTIQDVKETWKLSGQDWRENNPQVDAEISTAIDEATSLANNLLQSRYSIAAIELSIPQDVVSFTKIKAAILVGSRFSTASSDEAQMLLELFHKQAMMYKNLLTTADLRDATNAVISTTSQVSFAPFSDTTLETLG